MAVMTRDIFTCRDCHKQFPVSESVKDASRKRGIMERCKDCDRVRKKHHRTENAEDVRVKVRDGNRALRRERKAAGLRWQDSLTDEQLARRRASSRKHNREKRWAEIGASQEYYDVKFEEQGGCCAVCGTDTPSRGRGGMVDEVFCIDHDHETGELRSLLCVDCNLLIANAHEDVTVLAAAARYLERWHELEDSR